MSCFHLFQSLSVIDDSNPGSPSSDLTGLVAEPNLSGRSHTLAFSSNEVSGFQICIDWLPMSVFVHPQQNAVLAGLTWEGSLSVHAHCLLFAMCLCGHYFEVCVVTCVISWLSRLLCILFQCFTWLSLPHGNHHLEVSLKR